MVIELEGRARREELCACEWIKPEESQVDWLGQEVCWLGFAKSGVQQDGGRG